MKKVVFICKIINRPAAATKEVKELILLDGSSDVVCFAKDKERMICDARI